MPDASNMIVWYYAAGVLPFALLAGWACGRLLRADLRSRALTPEARRRAVWGFAASGLVWLPLALQFGQPTGPVFLAAVVCIYLPALITLSGSPTAPQPGARNA